jgi:alpha,alpha-trehalase
MAWELTYDSYRPEQERLRESLCALGNGYFVTRGAAPDAAADDTHYPGTYIAGLYDRLTSTIDGHEIENEDLVNAPNWLPLTFRIGDGPWFALDAVQILEFSQRLDLRCGVLIRTVRFCDDRGRITRWEERRLVSMAERHRAGLAVELVAENWNGPITIRTQLDASVVNDGVARYRGLANRHLRTLDVRALAPARMFLHAETVQSRVEIALAAELRLSRAGSPVEATFETSVGADVVEQRARTTLNGSPLRIEKLIALYTSRDPAISEAGLAARECIERSDGFDGMLARHRRAWHQLWERCDLAFDSRSDNGEPMKLRLHIFHQLQTVSPNTMDYDVGVPARGWHGEAYRGHVFWDELFILPFLTLRMPELVRDTLRYRYRRLEAARHAARDRGFRGAMFPWQSGSDGREESQRLHLNPRSGRWVPDNTHRQRHVNAAIGYNVWQYWEGTRDDEFLFSHGAELFLSIAQFWASAAQHDPRSDRYEIKGVMGPDEFHTAYPGVPPENESGIDNNAYTNVLVAWLLSRARDIVDLLPRVLSRALLERLDIDLEELERWYEISRKLKVPFHADGVISQFEGYEHLEELDWPRYRAQYGNIQRLDRILEAEGDSVNRYKVSKQPDVLMLFYLFSAEELVRGSRLCVRPGLHPEDRALLRGAHVARFHVEPHHACLGARTGRSCPFLAPLPEGSRQRRRRHPRRHDARGDSQCRDGCNGRPRAAQLPRIGDASGRAALQSSAADRGRTACGPPPVSRAPAGRGSDPDASAHLQPPSRGADDHGRLPQPPPQAEPRRPPRVPIVETTPATPGKCLGQPATVQS